MTQTLPEKLALLRKTIEAGGPPRWPGCGVPSGARFGADFPVDNPAAAATYRFCKLLAI
jgi:hypothetical protein